MENNDQNTKIEEIYAMMKTMMKKLDTLEHIEKRIKAVEQDVKDLKTSLEYAHLEVVDIKKEFEENKEVILEVQTKIQNLEETNRKLQDNIIDLKARSMRDNLLFFNISEDENENTTETIHDILENQMGFEDAKNRVKIDRSHRLGKPTHPSIRRTKPRPIVAKFNFFQDREFIRKNARKLKGTRIGISEQFPEEIEAIRRNLYPEMKKAKFAAKRVRLTRDKLFIDGVEFKHS
jgi:DNA repair ATPase RecN